MLKRLSPVYQMTGGGGGGVVDDSLEISFMRLAGVKRVQRSAPGRVASPLATVPCRCYTFASVYPSPQNTPA